jgi:hypothetical protein
MKISTRSAKVLIPLLALSFATAMAPARADSSNGDGQKSGVIYNSVISPLPGNLPSYGFESVAFNELGNAVNFSSSGNHSLSKVVVTMSSWGCVSGSWSLHTCSTPEDATFAQPITLNVYGPSTDGGSHPGPQLASITNTFNLKFRPSASPLCVGDNIGKWYEKSSKTCFNGLAQNITFNLKNVKVGGNAIFGIAYNTTHYGYAPIGEYPTCFHTTQGCPYDSLNVALTQDPTNVTVGSSVDVGKAWFASTYAGWYTDGGAAGVGSFRLDSPNVAAAWGVSDPASAPWYVPAIKVFANGEGKGDNQSDEKSPSSKAPDNNSDGKQGIKKD